MEGLARKTGVGVFERGVEISMATFDKDCTYSLQLRPNNGGGKSEKYSNLKTVY